MSMKISLSLNKYPYRLALNDIKRYFPLEKCLWSY